MCKLPIPSQAVRGLVVLIVNRWADGMGNPLENRLPDCQLARIQEMVNNLDFPGRDLSLPVAFWMDTLCIPVADKYKPLRKECIKSMRLIYSEASAVLVLDAWMQKVPLTTPASERSIRFYTSSWLRRLWTFQEGILNKKVFLPKGHPWHPCRISLACRHKVDAAFSCHRRHCRHGHQGRGGCCLPPATLLTPGRLPRPSRDNARLR
jgi:hypothetical protein